MTLCEYVSEKNIASRNLYPIALDIGYSAVKGFAENAHFCFPSCAREADSSKLIGSSMKTDIFYRDDDLGEWSVGRLATLGTLESDSEDSENTLYGRNRYFSPRFLILARVGMALGLMRSGFDKNRDDKEIFIETGLPPAYKKADAPLLSEVLAGDHRFSVNVGGRGFENFDIHIPKTGVHVLDQPMGSVFCASLAPDLSQIPAPSGKKLADSSVLVFDAGFGTLDVYNIMSRERKGFETWSELGMRAVFARLSAHILECFGNDIKVHAMQTVLEKGFVTVFDRKERRTRDEPIAHALEKASSHVLEKALAKLDQTFDSLRHHEVLLVTGGTGEAWFEQIERYYSGMKNLSVRGASHACNLPPVYGNVRGYYLYRILTSGRDFHTGL
jgi:plasmid segregation protein ParM